jgi:mRNA-degrading endonuclease RelE of RelBE toxin-antitoxin system
MSYNLELSNKFKKRFKKLSNKHRSLEKDVDVLIESLLENPHQGILVQENVYKIRLAITSKGRGKSGGARVITYVVDEQERITLLDIYDKSEKENISDIRIKNIIEGLE